LSLEIDIIVGVLNVLPLGTAPGGRYW